MNINFILNQPTRKQTLFIYGYIGRHFRKLFADYKYTASNGVEVNSPIYGYEQSIKQRINDGTLSKNLASKIISLYDREQYEDVIAELKKIGINFLEQ